MYLSILYLLSIIRIPYLYMINIHNYLSIFTAISIGFWKLIKYPEYSRMWLIMMMIQMFCTHERSLKHLNQKLIKWISVDCSNGVRIQSIDVLKPNDWTFNFTLKKHEECRWSNVSGNTLAWLVDWFRYIWLQDTWMAFYEHRRYLSSYFTWYNKTTDQTNLIVWWIQFASLISL